MKHLTTEELIEAMKKPVGSFCKFCGAASKHDKTCPERDFINPMAMAHHKEYKNG